MTKTVALVLGSGGARGMAHIGVIKEIEARGYKIISVSGCSMGAVIGGFYCANKLDEFYAWAKSLNYLDLLRLVDFSFISNGAIRGDKVFSLLAEMLDDIQIENLDIPFTAVTTDLAHSKEVWFQRGSLEQAMRASAAIPGLFQPVKLDDRLFVDGGVLNPLPIAASVSAHADYIIAIDLNADVPMPEVKKDLVSLKEIPEPSLDENDKNDWLNSIVNKASQWFTSEDDLEGDVEAVKAKAETDVANLGKLEILYQMFEVMQASLSQYKVAGYPPDLLVRIPQTSGEMYEFHRTEELVSLGGNIASQALDAFEQGHSSLYGQRLG
ncbi:MAG: patatin-like phospholipase family protein [Oleispira sp.]|nr:patatin-like phospholipase family protein [Oleispira sp.]